MKVQGPGNGASAKSTSHANAGQPKANEQIKAKAPEEKIPSLQPLQAAVEMPRSAPGEVKDPDRSRS